MREGVKLMCLPGYIKGSLLFQIPIWHSSFSHKDTIHHLYTNSISTHGKTSNSFVFAIVQCQIKTLSTVFYKPLNDDAINDSYNRLHCRFLAFLLLDHLDHLTRNNNLHYQNFLSFLLSSIYQIKWAFVILEKMQERLKKVAKLTNNLKKKRLSKSTKYCC